MDAGREDVDFEKKNKNTDTKENDLNIRIGGPKATVVQLFHMPCLKEFNHIHRKTLKTSLSYCFSPKKASKYW